MKPSDWTPEKLENFVKVVRGMKGLNLSGVVKLRGADLRGADLRGADLWGTNLRDANLSDANLRGANLRGNDLNWVYLHGAKYDEDTKFPDGFDPEEAGMVLVE